MYRSRSAREEPTGSLRSRICDTSGVLEISRVVVIRWNEQVYKDAQLGFAVTKQATRHQKKRLLLTAACWWWRRHHSVLTAPLWALLDFPGASSLRIYYAAGDEGSDYAGAVHYIINRGELL